MRSGSFSTMGTMFLLEMTLTSKIAEWRLRLSIAIIFVHILTSAISQYTCRLVLVFDTQFASFASSLSAAKLAVENWGPGSLAPA